MLQALFGHIFWAPILFKQYQNTSGCGNDIHKLIDFVSQDFRIVFCFGLHKKNWQSLNHLLWWYNF